MKDKKKEKEAADFLKSLNKETQQFVAGELERQEKRISAELLGDAKTRFLRDAANRFLDKKKRSVDEKKLTSKNRVKKTSAKLTCQLTEKELRERGGELASVVHLIKSTEAEKKKIMDDFKAKLSEFESRELNLSNVVKSCEELRDVAIEIEYRWKDNRKWFRRMDTGDVYDKRPIEEHERQFDFFEVI